MNGKEEKRRWVVELKQKVWGVGGSCEMWWKNEMLNIEEWEISCRI
jgi:hypothetical protein